MTKEEAIKILKAIKVYECYPKSASEETKVAIDMAIEVLSAEAAQGWIPVSERLPEKDGKYLICTNWDYLDVDVYRWADGWNCTRRIDGKVDREDEIDGANIIAWMPLPELYKGGDNK